MTLRSSALLRVSLRQRSWLERGTAGAERAEAAGRAAGSWPPCGKKRICQRRLSSELKKRALGETAVGKLIIRVQIK